MNYEAHYNTLIERARTRLLEGYSERHHIVPRCIGGDDSADNLVRLTAEEHYVAHQLLVKIYPGHRGLVYAARMMTTDSNGGRVNNKLYGWLKKQYSIARTGFKHTAEARAKISAAQLGTTHSAETKAKMSASAMGKPKSDAARKAMSIAKKGKPSPKKGIPTGLVTAGSWKKGNVPWNTGMEGLFKGGKHTNEMKAHLSAVAKARPKVECPHCNKIGQRNAMMQHHFDKCKMNTEVV